MNTLKEFIASHPMTMLAGYIATTFYLANSPVVIRTLSYGNWFLFAVGGSVFVVLGILMVQGIKDLREAR